MTQPAQPAKQQGLRLEKHQKFAAKTAAPPARSIAAVGTAASTPPPAGMVAGMKVVVGLMPEVNGASATAVTPANAGACVEADGLGVAEVFEGFRTLDKVSPGQRSSIMQNN